MEPTPPRRPQRRRHVAARSRVAAVVGSVAACLGLTWGFAHQNLGASTAASSPATPQQGAGRGDGVYPSQPNQDYGVPADPYTSPAPPISNGDGFGSGSGSGAVPGQSGGGANTTSGGS